ncbi:HD domain-containing protein [Streptomyces tropicalis]|uniref:ATP-binding protein n=1 Tax=Streptomyces tropicalis TaxID=3034234 RepID=A0ABT5ZZS5_9ACTN|nr:ATP-binding protein [Streptomyces tropicalis]MDF3297885.1 ATP-binding protein [Streptomyces tropicalis]
MTEFPSLAEQYADEACRLAAFGGFNLTQARRELEELLGRIGHYGFFDEYTKHDITHIDAMLKKLDWLVTPQTREAMTPADWLLIVLSVYFHDLGMLVTKDEYERRDESEFSDFCRSTLNTPDAEGRDYSARLTSLSKHEREKFLYQEFVRYNHAARVRKWVEGDSSTNLGASERIVSEVQQLLSSIESVFKEDLAKVCESHHLDDLYDVKKYPVDQYYGSSDLERANVQFAAVLLRTVDLLHITRDRTPSVAFRVFNPSDPISQNEWAKQSAVRAVVAMKGTDKDGIPSDTAPQDAIAIHATFTDENGFFGLTSYLKYAADQLRKSHEWVQRSNSSKGSKYFFPWKVIDTTRVEARGFLTEPFQFTIDQERVLDLLTGHTLYNDTNVVLRELVQNSIDAVRVKHGSSAPQHGEVRIRWNSEERTLEVCDNGTGMTQGVIENNLLRAGSSLYQDPEFRKKNPSFSPISRFGIGVLSTFMVADQVEIITCHPDEEKARQLSLRSVHGQYLVRTLEKNHEVPASIRPHGTIVKLTLRPSAELKNVTKTAQHWIVLPGCNVTVQEDEEAAQTVGYSSVGHALEDSIRHTSPSRASALKKGEIKVVERQNEGMSIAYALRWNEHFREWTFLAAEQRSARKIIHDAALTTGVCVSGIRVEQVTPGFRSIGPIAALANTFGPMSPRTNVARSTLEPTPELSDFVRQCYEAYCRHVIEEIQQLQTERQHSITWATEEAVFIAGPLRKAGSPPLSSTLLREAIQGIPFFLVEEEGVRKRVTVQELRQYDRIETTESAVTEHVEYLLRELPGGTRESVLDLLRAHQNDNSSSSNPILCSRLGRTDEVDELFLSEWEIGEVAGDIGNRTCSVTWFKKTASQRWTPEDVLNSPLDLLERERDSYSGQNATPLVRVPIGEVAVSGFSDNMRGFIAGDTRYLLPGHPWQGMVDVLTSEGAPEDSATRLLLLCWLITQRTGLEEYYSRFSGTRRAFSAAETQETLLRLGLLHLVDWSEFVEIARSGNASVQFFDTRKWQRWGGGYGYFQ